MNAAQIDRREFSFAQVMYSEPYACHKFVVGTPSRREAKIRAEAFATRRWGKPRKLFVYPKTYVVEARRLIAQGLHD